MSHRRYSVIACDVRKDHRCHRLTTPEEQHWMAVRKALIAGWDCTDESDTCPACREGRA